MLLYCVIGDPGPNKKSLFVQIAGDCIWTHGHWTRMHRACLKTRSDFTVREVSPAFRFTKPFPTVVMVKHCALAA
jgi:hypothetical protein